MQVKDNSKDVNGSADNVTVNSIPESPKDSCEFVSTIFRLFHLKFVPPTS